MTFRDNVDALSARAESLEAELADANKQLDEARERIVKEAKKDEQEAKRLSELETEVNALREKLGMQKLTLSREKPSPVGTYLLVGYIVFAVLFACGSALSMMMVPVDQEPPAYSMLLFSAVWAMFGVPMMVLAVGAFGKDRDIAKWPKVTGRMIQSEVESYWSTEKDRYGYYQSYEYFTPKVTYTYSVDGDDYTGSAVSRVAGATTNAGSIQQWVDEHPAGKEVEVLHDPEDPNTAYLEVRTSVGAVILFSFGLLLTGIGGLFVYLYFVM